MYTAETEESILGGPVAPDYVLDAIDNIDTKVSEQNLYYLYYSTIPGTSDALGLFEAINDSLAHMRMCRFTYWLRVISVPSLYCVWVVLVRKLTQPG